MILLSHATGNEFVRAALEAFDRAGMLSEFLITLSWSSKSPVNRLLPRGLRDSLQRRAFPEAVRSHTRSVPFRESVRLLAGAIGIPSKHETGAFSVDAVLRELDRIVSERLQ